MKKAFISFLWLHLVLISLASAKIYKPLDDLGQIYRNEVRGKSAHAIQQLGLKEYQDFLSMNVNNHDLHKHYNSDSRKPIYLSMRQARDTMRATNNNPIVSLHMYSKYDPKDQGIGFCFGRAMFIDLYLAINGLNRGSIKKAFVVGPMTTDGAKWAWHVTTIVQSIDRNNNKVWLAIDPIVDRVMELRQWYKEILTISDDKKLRLYITEAGKFAHTASRYDERTITNSFYNKYFSDMMKWFSDNDISQELGLQ
jgi:hypothetical protein